MIRRSPLIFQITQSPSGFRVLGFFMAAHLELFQILLLFHNNNNRMLYVNIMTELAIWNIVVMIFIRAIIMVSILILHTNTSKTSLLQEQIFILDASLLGNGLQQPKRYFNHKTIFVLEYWKFLQLISLHLLTLYLTRGEMMVMHKFQNHIKWAWATTCHTIFIVVARDKVATEHAFGWWSALNHLCEVETSLQRIRDTSSSRRL